MNSSSTVLEKVMLPELNKIHVGDCLAVMKMWPENFVDSVITDPPYGLSFMGKDWDHGIPGEIYWREALRVAKPGAMLLAFGGTRTYHRLAVAIEDAGWQIRDCLMWLYGSGFPKSHNLHGEFDGWGTALKPAWEPIILAMKPLDGTFAENAERWGVAGLNVDGCRIPTDEVRVQGRQAAHGVTTFGGFREGGKVYDTGRWPANLILDEDAAGMLDGVSGASASKEAIVNNKGTIWGSNNQQPWVAGHNDAGGASRFFYVAKSASSERNEGCEALPDKSVHRYNAGIGEGHTPDAPVVEKNFHPTVKPLELMKYLCQLTKTPAGGVVLDPFSGSGTTLWAAECHARPWVGIELNPDYARIAEARLARERSQMKMPL